MLSLLPAPGRESPKTPIRWLCIRAFSYLGLVERRSLDSITLDRLCQAMELGIFLNRCFDGKSSFCSARYRDLRRPLPHSPTQEYLRELRGLEQEQPDLSAWKDVYQYRRGVLKVSLSYLFTLAKLRDRSVLLPICSLVQLIDDVLDRKTDSQLKLPTFITADGPAASALAKGFWRELRDGREPDEMPFVASGWLVYLLARLVIVCCRD